MARKSSTRARKKTVVFKDKTYIGVLKNGVLSVKFQNSAKGQLLTAGSYDIATATWQNGSRKAPLPGAVRTEFEKAFGLLR